jgi:secernin
VKDTGSISNAITIGREWDLASPNLVNFAIDQGWCKQRERFHFADCYSDFLYTRFSDAVNRQGCTTGAIRAQRGKITSASMMGILRSHQGQGSTWTPGPAVTGADVCMHAGWGPIRESQTTGSMVAHFTPEIQTLWVTATAAPCTSIFKPVWMDTGLPDTGPVPNDTCDSSSLWWRHELLHRDTLQNYPARLAAYRGERDRLEAQFVAGSEQLRPECFSERKAFSEASFQQADRAESDWRKSVRAVARKPGWWFYYREAWQRFDRLAKIS